MADTVTSQTLFDGHRRTIMKFTCLSDGTGETAVTKVDVSELTGAPERVRIDRIHYTTSGLTARLLWDADTDVQIIELPASTSDTLDFVGFGGLRNNGGTGATGDIKLTTAGASSGDGYTIVLEMARY